MAYEAVWEIKDFFGKFKWLENKRKNMPNLESEIENEWTHIRKNNKVIKCRILVNFN